MGVLGEHLDVVSDERIGPRLPNQVSGAEFSDAMGLYESIRAGQSNLAITPGSGRTEAQASEFHGDVMADVARLMSTDQGRGLLHELATGEDGNDNKVIIGEGDHADTGWAQALEPERAMDGTGTHAGVFYEPNVIHDFRRGNTNPENDWAFMGSAETLFHELVHAKEIQEGSFSSEVVGDRASRPAEADIRVDEYQAVGIGEFAGEYSENAFRRERALVTGNRFAQRDHYGVALSADEIEHGHTSTIDLGKTPSHR